MRRVAIALAIVVVAACGSSPSTGTSTTIVPGSGDPERGLVIYNGTCVACHGPGGIGVAGLGKPLTTSPFAGGLSDAELLTFLDVGRAADDPLNTTGIAMPSRGGNPSLTDADLMDVIAYLRTIG